MIKSQSERTVWVCHSTGCLSGRAAQIREALERLVAEFSLGGVGVDFTGCHGFCQQGPIVVVEPEDIFYTHVTPDDAPDIVKSHLRDGKPLTRLFYKDPASGEFILHYRDIDFYRKQRRIVLRNCGHVNPERIDDYLVSGGYQSLKKALLN